MKPVYLITGAGGRLGSALCETLRESCHVVGAYRKKMPLISSQIRHRLGNRDDGYDIFCVQADLTSRDDIERLVELTLTRYGRLDSVINCAADIRFHGKLLDMWQAEDYAGTQMNTNLLAPMLLISHVHDLCWKDNTDENARVNRSVVNVSSASGLQACADGNQAVYGASKAALNLLTLYLALELAPYSVRANAICPRRFSDPVSTARVVAAVSRLLRSEVTGEIVSEI